MKKILFLMLCVVGLSFGVSYGAVVSSISDDFSGDLSKWNVNTSPTTNAVVTIATESGYLKENIVTSDTSYSSGTVTTKDSVASNNQVIMEWDFYYPSDKVSAKGYALWRVTPQSNGGAQGGVDYYSTIASGSDRWHWLEVYDDDGNRTQYKLGLYGEGWKIYNDHVYHGILTLDFVANQVTLELQSDGTVYFDGSSATDVSKTVQLTSTQQSSYYGYIYISGKSYDGSQQVTEHRTDNFELYSVPEPATIGLIVFGLMGLIRRRK